MGLFQDIFGGGEQPAVDPLIGQAALANANLSKESLDWYKSTYANDIKPRQAEQDALVKQVADAQLASQAASDSRSADQYKFWLDNYKGLEEQSATEAAVAGGAADQERAAGRAVSDVRQQSSIAQGTTNRNLAAMGVNPNSGKFASANRAMDLGIAASSAGAATNSRETAKNTGIALRSGATATGRGLQNLAGQTLMQGASAGSNAAMTGANNVNSGIASTGVMGNGFNTAGNLNSSSGSIANAGYNSTLNGWGANQQANASGMAGLGSAIGLGMSFAPSSWFKSSKSFKTNNKNVDDVDTLDRVNRLPIDSWSYKQAHGGTSHIGPYAEDVRKQFGRKVAPGGKVIDAISMNGITLSAIKGLSNKMGHLEAKVAKLSKAKGMTA